MNIVSRQFIAYFVGASAVFIFVRQLGTTLLLRNLRRSAHRWRTAVVIGDDEATCEHFAGLLTATHPMGYQQVVVQPTRRAVNHNGNGNGHGNGKGAESGYNFDAASFAQFDDVYLIGVNDGADSPAGAEGVLTLLKQGKSVHIIPSLLDTRLFRQSLGDVAGIPVLSVSKGELSPIQSAVKRAVDFVLSSVLLIVLSPLIGADRARGQMDLAGTGAVSAEAPRPQRRTLYPLQVPHDARRRGADPEELARAVREISCKTISSFPRAKIRASLRSENSCAPPASTSCRNCSTC